MLTKTWGEVENRLSYEIVISALHNILLIVRS